MASIFEFGLMVLSKLIAVDGIMFSESLRLKLEDFTLDLRMKWIPVREGKNPVLAIVLAIAIFQLKENQNDHARLRKMQSHN